VEIYVLFAPQCNQRGSSRFGRRHSLYAIWIVVSCLQISESVQGWRQKWFYIKDQKISAADECGLAPFDAGKGLTKLTSWDAFPSDAEVKEIKPLLART
jgi:hypothetical protein